MTVNKLMFLWDVKVIHSSDRPVTREVGLVLTSLYIICDYLLYCLYLSILSGFKFIYTSVLIVITEMRLRDTNSRLAINRKFDS